MTGLAPVIPPVSTLLYENRALSALSALLITQSVEMAGARPAMIREGWSKTVETDYIRFRVQIIRKPPKPIGTNAVRFFN